MTEIEGVKAMSDNDKPFRASGALKTGLYCCVSCQVTGAGEKCWNCGKAVVCA